jgi:hypothetical protein
VRHVALFLILLALVAPAAVLAAAHPAAGALSVEGGKGLVIVRGNGGLLGRVTRGSVEILDLTPGDAWRPTVNGTTRSRRMFMKGANLSFRILGGEYRVTTRGDGISISARGSGVATLLGAPGLTGETGIFSADINADCQDQPQLCDPVPTNLARVTFGPEKEAKTP